MTGTRLDGRKGHGTPVLEASSDPATSARGQATDGASRAPSGLPSQGDLVGGKYRLETLIARGGMAAVWLAYNETLDVRVAVKFIRADLADGKDPRLADRLLQEARSTARLGHPAIVQVHDYGKTNRGVPYLVMELLEGESLDVALERRGRVAARKAVRALLPVAHALAAAHGKGIIHRDLKPENVFMAQTAGRRIQPKLIDFGISKVKQRGGKRLTFIGEAVGTPAYMSPEQAIGTDIDHRSDIWAFCVMLYELVTGSTPFHGATITAMARAIIDEAPQPITSFSAGDDQLWSILEKGLAKQPDDRWQTMRELGGELACWLIDRGLHEDVSGGSLEAAWLLDPAKTELEDAFASVPPPARRSGPGRDVDQTAADETSGGATTPSPQAPPQGRRALSTAQTLPSGPSLAEPSASAPAELIAVLRSEPPKGQASPPKARAGPANDASLAAEPAPPSSSPDTIRAGRGIWLAITAAGLLIVLGAILGLLL